MLAVTFSFVWLTIKLHPELQTSYISDIRKHLLLQMKKKSPRDVQCPVTPLVLVGVGCWSHLPSLKKKASHGGGCAGLEKFFFYLFYACHSTHVGYGTFVRRGQDFGSRSAGRVLDYGAVVPNSQVFPPNTTWPPPLSDAR